MAEPKSYRYFAVERYSDGTYLILNRRTGKPIGAIEWYRHWLRWVFSPDANTVWSAGCLRDALHFLGTLPKGGPENA